MPADGDGIFLELFWHSLQQIRRALGDVGPEEQAAVQWPQRVVDLLHEAEVDRAESLLIHSGLRLPHTEIEGLVCADMQERRGVERSELSEHLVDHLERTGLSGREHRTV